MILLVGIELIGTAHPDNVEVAGFSMARYDGAHIDQTGRGIGRNGRLFPSGTVITGGVAIDFKHPVHLFGQVYDLGIGWIQVNTA